MNASDEKHEQQMFRDLGRRTAERLNQRAVHVVIAGAVHGMQRSAGAEQVKARGQVTKRNARCPCGSGKKFKVCCRRPAANIEIGDEEIKTEIRHANF